MAELKTCECGEPTYSNKCSLCHADESVCSPQRQPLTDEQEQEPKRKYRRGDRLLCLETEEYCVIHISGTDRQWVKFPDTDIVVYTNEQVSELFEKLAKETDLSQPEQEPHGWYIDGYGAVIGTAEPKSVRVGEWLPWYTTPPQRKPLTDEQIKHMPELFVVPSHHLEMVVRAIESAHGIKGEA